MQSVFLGIVHMYEIAIALQLPYLGTSKTLVQLCSYGLSGQRASHGSGPAKYVWLD